MSNSVLGRPRAAPPRWEGKGVMHGQVVTEGQGERGLPGPFRVGLWRTKRGSRAQHVQVRLTHCAAHPGLDTHPIGQR